MKAKGLWTARPLRTGVESLAPSILLCLIPPLLHIENYLSLGRLYILVLLSFLWIIIWPAYRLQKAPTPWNRSIRYWLFFLICYASAASALSMLQYWVLLQTPAIQRLQPFDHLNHLLTIKFSDFWDLFYIIPSLFLVRLLIYGWIRLMRWISHRLIRQLTFSHILAIVATLWLFACMYFVYLIFWEYPKWINGMSEAEKVADWASPIIQSSLSPSSNEAWLRQVKQTQKSPIEPFVTKPILHRWTLYNLQAEPLAQSDSARSRFPHEATLVERVLKRQSAELLIAGAFHNTFLAAVPILDGPQESVIGVVVHEKSYTDPLTQASAFSVAFVSFLGFSIVLFLVSPMLVALVGLIFAYWRASVFRRRIQPFIDIVPYWSSGHLQKRLQTDYPDELGALSQQLNQMADSLQHAMQSLHVEKQQVEFLLRSNRKLVADVSHELRTPLSILSSYLEEWQKKDYKGVYEHLPILKRETKRLQAMIDELFQMTTLAEQPQTAIKTHLIDPTALIREVVETMKPIAWKEQNITITALFADDLSLIQAERDRLRQIMYNLIRNALRHTPEGGLVKVTGTQDEKALFITVADTGSGIPLEDLPHIFSRYYRGKNAPASSGRGLGLAIAKEWLDHMGASISVESHPGKETRFIIKFPIPKIEKNPERPTDSSTGADG